MANLTGWAVSALDKVVRQFRTEVEERAKKIAEGRKYAEPRDAFKRLMSLPVCDHAKYEHSQRHGAHMVTVMARRRSFESE